MNDFTMPKQANLATNQEGTGYKPKYFIAEESLPGHNFGRGNMRTWLDRIQENVYLANPDFQHTAQYHLGSDFDRVHEELVAFGAVIPTALEPAVAENDNRFNNPRVEQYNSIGERDDRVIHHPSYAEAGNLIYGADIVRKLVRRGGLREGFSLYFLSNHAGEAGHNCPVICNFETARLLRELPEFQNREHYISKLEFPSYDQNYTASQFLTEVQGGSDVGANATMAWRDETSAWRIRGEKWFCSNADADLMVISARYEQDTSGTKGLAMFIVPALKPDGTRNDYTFRRLKEKMGTRALASSEIDFHDAYAINLGPVDKGFNRLMESVIHYSRIALATAVMGIMSRAYQVARVYADTRWAFGQPVISYPLVQENLARIKADLTAGVAGTFALIAMQDDVDTGKDSRPQMKAFVRFAANFSKSLLSKWAVDRTHNTLDVLAGNGAIETTSCLPRLFRDSVILENWEGTHNTLLMQVLRDIQKFSHDEACLAVLRERLAGLEDRPTEHENARRAFTELAAGFAALRSADPQTQTLLIQRVVERAGSLFYYIEAVREGSDQEKRTGRSSKLAAAEYFRIMRIQDAKPVYDAGYRRLIAAVVDAGGADRDHSQETAPMRRGEGATV